MKPLAALAALAAALAVPAQAQELPVGQSEADYEAWVAAAPGRRGQVLSFESWEEAAGVKNVLPTWQVIRTATMWRECGGQPFEIPPFQLWPGLTRTLAFIRDRVKGAVGEVEAVSGYRNPTLNTCARGSPRSAHQGYFALDLIPLRPLDRHELFRRLCAMHRGYGRGSAVGLGFYAYQRFHIDTNGFRRWGAAGPAHNESPCALIERGEDPEPPAPPAAAPFTTVPTAPPPTTSPAQPQ